MMLMMIVMSIMMSIMMVKVVLIMLSCQSSKHVISNIETHFS